MLVYHPSTETTTKEKIRRPKDDEVVWLRLLSPKKEEVQHVLEDLFQCHPLIVEDCVKMNQRPKMDHYKNHVFISFYAVDKDLHPIEIAMVIGENHVVTIYNQEIPFLEEIYQEFEQIAVKMAHPGDILYHILDHCVDEYSLSADHIEDLVDKMERRIYRDPHIRVAHEIFRIKRSMHMLRRILSEEKTILGSITHQSFPFIRQESEVYFIDVYDHISRVVDSLDIFRESLTGLLEMQMSMKSDRMNEIMKILTIFNTIFLPLTFIVGLYGMNFTNMPELSWKYGYAFVWILLILITVSMWVYFKKKKWL